MTAVTARRLARPRAATAARPRWAGIGLGALLAGTALLYLAGLSRNGWANDFYAAAVQAGTRSWKAFFFGSFDASNFITVDKTPASLWVMELSGRIFGLSYWSMLVPQALEGVGSVALLYATVRRWFGPGAGLLAGAALALTPVAALMFRFNNPDALLVLLMTAAAYGTARAIESGRTRWLVLAGTLLGLAFLAKMLQAFLVVPGFGLAYLVAGPPRLRTRIWQLLAALGAVVAGAGWWVAAVVLTPAASRPYVGGSTNDSILQLALGYNGLGRLDGNETGSVGFGGGRGGGGGSAFGGAAGLQRLFASEMGGQISWLLPAALVAMVALGWLAWRANRGPRAAAVLAAGAGGAAAGARGVAAGAGGAAAGPGGPGLRLRSDPALAALLLWGSWLLVTGLVFSFMAGIIHPYYTVALAPPIAALAGTGAVALWRDRSSWPARGLLAAGAGITACWSYLLLARSPSWYPELRWAVLIVGLASAVVLALSPRPGTGRVTVAGVAAAAAIAAGLAGPAAYSLDTAATAHAGALPTAGPAVTSAFAGPGGGPGGTGGFGGPGAAGGRTGTGAGAGTGRGTGGTGTGGTGTGGAGAPGQAPSGFPGAGGRGTGTGHPGTGTGTGTGTGGFPRRGGAAGTGGGAGGPGGGLGGSTQVSTALAGLLEKDASAYTWAAATVGSESAAPLQLATGQPVMSIGGFNGTDPAPTLAQFKKLVAEHKIHYFVGENTHSFGGGSGAASAISTWVAAHFTAQTVGGETVYDLAGSS